jgi:hypothetical protein
MRIYFTFSSYHLLLASALQQQAGDPEACIVYADESGLLRQRPEALRLLQKTHVELLPPMDRSFRARDLWEQRANRLRAQSIVGRYAGTGDEIMVCNSTRPETQWLKGRVGKRYALHYVEDGLDAYAAVNKRPVSPTREAAHWVVYGRRHPSVTDMLLRLPFESYHVLFPGLFRLQVDPRRIVPIDEEVLRRQVEQLGQLIGIEPDENAPFTHFRALRHTERIADVPAYVAEACTWARKVRGVGGRAAVKAHPRETNVQLLRALREIGATELPRELPAEVLTRLLSPDCSITCGLSTFVLTSRIMLPGRRVYLEGAVDRALADRLAAWDAMVAISTEEVRCSV